MRRFTVVLLLLYSAALSGCAIKGRQVKVLSSKDMIREQYFYLEDGDVLICDPRGCKVTK